MSSPRHVVVLGAGIAGLAAARALRRDLPPGTRLTLVDADRRVGGKLRTEQFAGVPLDLGADMWLARVPEATRLARETGLAGQLVEPLTSQAYVVVGGRLRPVPEGVGLGLPTRPGPLVRSRVLSPRGLVRAAIEPLLPGRPVTGPVSVGAVVRRRFGAQVVDRLVDPLLGGVYAGRADELDLDAAAPQIAPLARGHRSLYLAARAARRGAPAPAGPAFLSVRSGLSAYAEAALRAAAADEVLLGVRAVLLERVGSGWRVTLAGGRALVVDAVVVATPAAPAVTLLAVVAPDASAALREVTYADVAIVALGYRQVDAQRLRGSGFLVPEAEGRTIKAATYTSRKWAHRAGGELAVVRCSVGRAGDPPPPDDDELVALAHQDLADLAGVVAPPVESLVARWPAGLPQYAVGHGERVARVEAAVEPLGGVAVAGAAYQGVGIPACVRSGEAAAERVVAHLTRGGRMTA